MGEIHELYLQISDLEKERAAFLAKVTDDNINELYKNSGNQTLLHMAIVKRDSLTALALIRKGAKLHLKDSNEYTAIDYAILVHDEQLLIEFSKHEHYGFNPNQLDSGGCTPLFWATKTGNINIIDLWLKLGANVHAINNQCDTILKSANNVVNEDFIFIMRLLLKWGIGIKNDFTGVALFNDITEGCILLNSYQDGKLITRQTPGCSNAYTNLQELNEAISTRKKINIICKTSVFEQHFSDKDVYNIYKLLHTTNSLKSNLLFFINDNPQKIKSLEFLPKEMKPEITTPFILVTGNTTS